MNQGPLGNTPEGRSDGNPSGSRIKCDAGPGGASLLDSPAARLLFTCGNRRWFE